MRLFPTIHVRRIVISLAVFFCFAASNAGAQSYRWRFALPESWQSVAFNPFSKGQVIFAGPTFVEGIFRSDDGGHTWVQHDSIRDPDATHPIIYSIHQVFVLPSDTSIVFAVNNTTLYRSTDGGFTWDDRYNNDSLLDLGGVNGETIGYNDEEHALYYGETYGRGLWRSTDKGADWTLVSRLIDVNNPDSIYYDALGVSQGLPGLNNAAPIILQSSFSVGNIARSSDLGQTWSVTFQSPQLLPREVPKIVFSWSALDPATGEPTVAIAQRWPTVDSSFLATTDGGLTWKILTGAPANVWGLDIDQRTSMLSKPGDPAYPRPLHFFTGLFDVNQDTIPNGLVQETTDGGISWHSIGFPKGVAGDTANPHTREIWVIKYDTTSGRLAVATDSGIYIGDPASGVVESQPAISAIQLTQDDGSVTLSAQTPIESIRLFDMLGRQIFESAPAQEVFRLATSQYPHGAYAIEAYPRGQPPFRKLVEW